MDFLWSEISLADYHRIHASKILAEIGTTASLSNIPSNIAIMQVPYTYTVLCSYLHTYIYGSMYSGYVNMHLCTCTKCRSSTQWQYIYTHKYLYVYISYGSKLCLRRYKKPPSHHTPVVLPQQARIHRDSCTKILKSIHLHITSKILNDIPHVCSRLTSPMNKSTFPISMGLPGSEHGGTFVPYFWPYVGGISPEP